MHGYNREYMSTIEDWITVDDAAALAGYHANYLRKLLRSGEIQGRKWGQTWMVNRGSLVAYLQKMDEKGEKRGPKGAIDSHIA